MPGTVAKPKETKNQKRRAAKKAKKLEQAHDAAPPDDDVPPPSAESIQSQEKIEDHFVAPEVSEDDPLYAQFKSVLDKFLDPGEDDPTLNQPEKPEVFFDDDDQIPDEEEETQPKVSKKKRKQQSKLSIAELKALVQRPDLVEWTDVDSNDPRLLLALRSHRNVVPVPSHWSLKREYLSSKRGIEKPAFALPKFIQETGIAEMRDAVLEKQAEASLKQKQRERVQPKMGKLDIDYQKLYEAFFRFQTKPELTRYGEVYYEGKEFETNLKHLRPGELSDELKEALNIPPGAPPPWLINQQRFGPPPSYPSLKIPGLNAPPPPGASWGFHPGGYGKPPVDEYNRPLYGGDVFGAILPHQQQQLGEPVEKALWGELEAPEESEEEEEDEEEEDQDEMEEDADDEELAAGMRTGIRTAAGTESVAPSTFGGTDTVQENFTLRKQRRGTETEEPAAPRAAGQVIPEQNVRSKGFFGSDRAYDFSGTQGNANLPVLGQEERAKKRKAGDVDVSVDVDALERDDKLSKDQLQKKYDEQRAAESASKWGAGVDQEDLDKMINEQRKKQKREEERRSRR